MMARYLSLTWAAIASGVGNHLWQSTVFAAVAGLLTLMFRKNQARIRYCLWLAASVKFLIPFSLLVGAGNHLAWLRGARTSTGMYFLMEEITQPLAQPAKALPASFPATPGLLRFAPLLPAILLVAWLLGSLLVLSLWCLRWWRISAAAREAVPATEGREWQMLRRLEGADKMGRPIGIRVSPASLEPGIFGILRPVLLWPAGISGRLSDTHLEAVLAHELRHVRRRDNLAAVLHMLVEALFWFHPLVWWMGAKLVEERERACDEEVLEMIPERQVYAESILKVCEFCVESPLACVAGVTGADLKKRMVHIMTENVARKLDLRRKVLLTAFGVLAIALPILFGIFYAIPSRAQAQSENAVASGAYQVASIKPNQSGANTTSKILVTPDGINFTGVTLQALIHFAYAVEPDQISGGPDWLNSARYDIAAKTDKSVANELRGLSEVQRRDANRQMLQGLLADQFKLRLHPESRVLPVYELVVAPDGPKLQDAKGMSMTRMGMGELSSQGAPISILADQLSLRLGQMVVDKTGLSGNYAFTLHWAPDASEEARLKPPAGMPVPEVSGPPLLTALQEQLGLELKPSTGPVEILVVDQAEQPAAN